MSRYESDYMMERRLSLIDPPLHRRYTDAVLVLQRTLSGFRRLFPDYTDHSDMHSMNVARFCNELIGEEQLLKLNSDEIYILLMSCYLHDVGMGISEGDYELFSRELKADEYFARHPLGTRTDFVRDRHHEFSACFIKKYADFLDIPSPEHAHAIAQVARGHRSTDIFSETEYPSAMLLPNGNTVCLPYLAALLRLADEIDVAADRNFMLDPGLDEISGETDLFHIRLAGAVKSLDISPDSFMMNIKSSDRSILASLENVQGKMQATLDLCRIVAERRTDFRITQTTVDARLI